MKDHNFIPGSICSQGFPDPTKSILDFLRYFFRYFLKAPGYAPKTNCQAWKVPPKKKLIWSNPNCLRCKLAVSCKEGTGIALSNFQHDTSFFRPICSGYCLKGQIPQSDGNVRSFSTPEVPQNSDKLNSTHVTTWFYSYLVLQPSHFFWSMNLSHRSPMRKYVNYD